jgi:hypothetical protein
MKPGSNMNHQNLFGRLGLNYTKGVSLDLITTVDYKTDDRPASSLITGTGEIENGEKLHGQRQGGLELALYSTKR